jgi:hypothetical protein
MIRMNHAFTNRSEEDEIYPLTVKKNLETHRADTELKHFFVHNATLDKGLEFPIVEDKTRICKKRRPGIPKPLE